MSQEITEDALAPLNPVYEASGGTRRYIDVRTTQLYNDPLYGKYRGVRFDQGLTAWVRLPLFSGQTGAPQVINVGAYSSSPFVYVRIKENTGVENTTYEPDVSAELSSDGRSIAFLVPPEVADNAGIYRAQARVVDENDVEQARDEVFIYVDRGMWLTDGSTTSDYGPPTFSEVRTAIRDHPGANRLLGDYEFDPAEIGQAVTSAVQEFNNGFPPLPMSMVYTTKTFPRFWRRQLLNGALAYLFETAATYFRRGHLPYNASGLAVDDLAKDKDYQMAVRELRAVYAQWIKTTRAAISVNAAYGSLSSGAPYRGTY